MNYNSDNVCKGYSNIGLISNLENTISSIESIPATYDVSIHNCKLRFRDNRWKAPLLGLPYLHIDGADSTDGQWTRTNTTAFKGKSEMLSPLHVS